jgi:hypothetical protein
MTTILKNSTTFIFVFMVVSSCTFNTGNDLDIKPPMINKEFYDDTIATSLLDWPEAEMSHPACSNSSTQQFTMPDIPAPTGNITIIPSANLQPVGVTEKILIEVPISNGSRVDTSMQGIVSVDAGQHATVIKTETMHSGIAQTAIRFNQAGLHTISVTLTTNEDTLFGTVVVMAFSTPDREYNSRVQSQESGVRMITSRQLLPWLL